MASESQTEIAPALARSSSDIGRSAARYLFAISVLSESSPERITTGAIREHMDVAPASVTEMVSKLEEQGLVDYEKYQGVILTDRGDALATRIGWRFCVVSTFFDSALDITLDDETAFNLGCLLPEDGIFRLQSLVDAACLGLCPKSNGDTDRCVA